MKLVCVGDAVNPSQPNVNLNLWEIGQGKTGEHHLKGKIGGKK
jgi:hypothetical protein